MNSLLLEPLSKAINSYLQLDPESTHRLAKLKGKIITIELLPFHFIFQCVFQENGIELNQEQSYPTDTTLRGTPLQMLDMLLTKNHRQQFFANDVVIEGDAAVGQDAIALFDELYIDWEDHLSHLIGDIPAFQLTKFTQRMLNKFKQTENTMTQNINEYIHEEKRWLPSAEALSDFFHEIDQLRMDVDRSEAKIKWLEKHLLTEENQ